MTKEELEKIERIGRKSHLLRDAWLRERRESLEQREQASNEVKKRWEESDGIERTQGGPMNGDL